MLSKEISASLSLVFHLEYESAELRYVLDDEDIDLYEGRVDVLQESVYAKVARIVANQKNCGLSDVAGWGFSFSKVRLIVSLVYPGSYDPVPIMRCGLVGMNDKYFVFHYMQGGN